MTFTPLGRKSHKPKEQVGLETLIPKAAGSGVQGFADTIRKGSKKRPWELAENAWWGGTEPPHEKQLAVIRHLDDPDPSRLDIGYGGAVGGGKTWMLAHSAIYLCLKYPGIEGVIARKHKNTLEETTLKALMNGLRFLRIHYELEYTYLKKEGTIQFHNPIEGTDGSLITLIELFDPEKIQGANKDFAIVDEATQIGPAAWGQLSQRLRNSAFGFKMGYPIRLVWGSNPRPGFLRQQYWEPYKEGKLGHGEYRRRVFIKATLMDNPNLPADYKDNVLRDNPGPLGEALVSGNWDVTEGVVFPELHDDTFREFDPKALYGRMKVEDAEHVSGYDYGYTHEMAYVRGLVLDGILYIFRELIESRVELEDFARVQQEVRGITYADKTVQTMFHRARGSSSINEELMRLGTYLEPANEGADHNIEGGVNTLRRLLRCGAIRIHPELCPKLKEGVQNWSHKEDPSAPGSFIEGSYSEDYKDRVDALRYLVINVADQLSAPEPELESADTRARADIRLQERLHKLMRSREKSLARRPPIQHRAVTTPRGSHK